MLLRLLKFSIRDKKEYGKKQASGLLVVRPLALVEVIEGC